MALDSQMSKGLNFFDSWVWKRTLVALEKANWIGVIGESGKSTLGVLTKELLAKKGLVEFIDFNGDLKDGLEKVKRIDKGVEFVVCEIHCEDGAYVPEGVKFDVLVVTGVGEDDEARLMYKRALKSLKEGGSLIIDFDDRDLISGQGSSEVSVMFFGEQNEGVHVWPENITVKNFRTLFQIGHGVEKVEVNSPLLGLHQVDTQLALAAVGVCFEMALTSVKGVIESIRVPNSNMEVFKAVGGANLINDNGSVSLASVKGALDTLDLVSARKRLIVVSGFDEEGKNKKLAENLFRHKLDYVFLVGEESAKIKDELLSLGYEDERLEFGLTNQQLINKLVKLLSKGDVVLFKVSREHYMEDVVTRLVELSVE